VCVCVLVGQNGSLNALYLGRMLLDQCAGIRCKHGRMIHSPMLTTDSGTTVL
jgi:hypothetical protein